MSIRVRWFPTLVKRSNSRQAVMVVTWRDGLSPVTIFLDEGFQQVEADHVVAVVNGTQAAMDAPLADGDELEFLVGISGG